MKVVGLLISLAAASLVGLGAACEQQAGSLRGVNNKGACLVVALGFDSWARPE